MADRPLNAPPRRMPAWVADFVLAGVIGLVGGVVGGLVVLAGVLGL